MHLRHLPEAAMRMRTEMMINEENYMTSRGEDQQAAHRLSPQSALGLLIRRTPSRDCTDINVRDDALTGAELRQRREVWRDAMERQPSAEVHLLEAASKVSDITESWQDLRVPNSEPSLKQLKLWHPTSAHSPTLRPETAPTPSSDLAPEITTHGTQHSPVAVLSMNSRRVVLQPSPPCSPTSSRQH